MFPYRVCVHPYKALTKSEYVAVTVTVGDRCCVKLAMVPAYIRMDSRDIRSRSLAVGLGGVFRRILDLSRTVWFTAR